MEVINFKSMSTTPPEGYDKKLWESIPAVRRQLYPGKHEILVYGQQSADGMHCLGCSWQVSYLMSEKEAKKAHNEYFKGEVEWV